MCHLSLSLSLSLSHTHTHTHTHTHKHTHKRSINNPHRDNGKVLVGNHRDIFYKEIKHVQQGLLSDPPNMIMYVEVPRISAKGRQRNLGLTRYRCLRNTSALEASFLHLRASVHPCGKSVGLSTLHVRLNMWDWSWNTRA